MNEVDHVIVGAGSAGCVLAARLSADPACTVLLLEAGGPVGGENERTPGRAPALWSGPTAYENRTTPQEWLGGRRIALTTGRGLGGGSSVNAMGWFHGHPEDYDGWAAQGATGWAWEDLAPYLRRIEDHEFGAGPYHGAGGPMAVHTPYHLHPLSARFIAAAAQLGWPVNPDLNGPAREGAGLVQSNIRDGVRHSVVDGYLAPALARANLTVRTGSPVDSLIVDGTRVLGVRCGASEFTARRSVILSAGAIRTPQLLMVSGIGPRDELREHGIALVADLPEVGRNLHDHPLVPLSWPILDAAALRGDLYNQPAETYRAIRRGPLSALAQVAAVVRSDPALTAPDLQLAISLRGTDAGGAPAPVPMVGGLVALLAPASRGTVTLGSPDPVVDPGFLTAAEDRAALRAGLRIALRLFGTGPLAEVTGPVTGLPADPTHADLDDYLAAGAGPYWHPAGTARIGSVVDPELHVRGVSGLRVVDTSVFPAVPRANTQASVIALAERAADLITGGR